MTTHTLSTWADQAGQVSVCAVPAITGVCIPARLVTQQGLLRAALCRAQGCTARPAPEASSRSELELEIARGEGRGAEVVAQVHITLLWEAEFRHERTGFR